MNGPMDTTQVGQLLLARLVVAGEKGATANDLKKALEPLIGHRWAGAALAGVLSEALDVLDAAGLATRTRKGKTERGTITPRGQRSALEFLGLDELPPKATWDQLKKTALAARALGLPVPTGKEAKSFGGDPGFKAALLKAQFDLPLDDFPTFDQAIDALAWKLLGFDSGPKLTLKGVKAAILARALDPGQRRLDPRADFKKEAARLLAREVGARQSAKDELRMAALRRWVDHRSSSPPTSIPEPITEPPPVPVPPPASASAPALAGDLDAFARRVLEAARESPTGRFGDNKVFIVHIFRALSPDPEFATMGLDVFKLKLAEANNARLLDLSRADMVEAMDPDDVSLSEVSYLGAYYHFVLIPPD